MTKITVLLCEPQAKPRVEDIDPDPVALAELLTGAVHIMDLGEGLCVVFDEDGNKKIKDLNRVIDSAAIFGLCIFCRHDEKGGLLPLEADEITNLLRLTK
jgi:hypothetical protein